MKKSQVSCPKCGRDGKYVGILEDHAIFSCKYCGLWDQTERIRQELLAKVLKEESKEEVPRKKSISYPA